MLRGRSENLVEIDSAKDLAIEHLFERSSVARELHAAGMPLRRGIGRVSVEAARIFRECPIRVSFVRIQTVDRPHARYWLKSGERFETCRNGQGAHEAIGRGKLGDSFRGRRKERRAIARRSRGS